MFAGGEPRGVGGANAGPKQLAFVSEAAPSCSEISEKDGVAWRIFFFFFCPGLVGFQRSKRTKIEPLCRKIAQMGEKLKKRGSK